MKAWWHSRTVLIHAVVLLAPLGFGRDYVHLPSAVYGMQLQAFLGLLLRFDTTEAISHPFQKKEDQS